MKIYFVTIFYLLLSVSLFAQNETEPNGGFGLADTFALTNLSITIHGTIDPVNDEDFIAIELPSEGVIIATIEDVPMNIRMEMSLYNPNQALNTTRQGGTGESVSITKKVCEAGIYYFRLQDDSFTPQSNTNQYSFTITLDTMDAYECNDQFLDAAQINLNSAIQAQIYSANDEDVFSVYVPITGVLKASVTNVPMNIKMRLTIYNSNQLEIESEQETSGSSVIAKELVCEPEIYYFKLEDNSFTPQFNSDLYSFKVELNVSDVYECNNSFSNATPISLCDTIYAAIYDLEDVDFYTFEGIEGQNIEIKLSNIAPSIKIKITLFDEDQQEIDDETGNQGQGLVYPYLIPSTKRYYLKVEDSNNNSEDSLLYRLVIPIPDCETTGMNIIPFFKTINLFPNPVTNLLTIETANLLGDEVTITITDITGKQLFFKKRAIQDQIFIDTEGFPRGLLLVNFKTQLGQYTAKVVKIGE